MCVLYSGIYRVALNLQRKSEAKHRKMASLVMAGGEMSKLGAGVLQPQMSDVAEDESTVRPGRLRQPGSRRQRPNQLATTSTTVLLSPRPVAYQVRQLRTTPR